MSKIYHPVTFNKIVLKVYVSQPSQVMNLFGSNYTYHIHTWIIT